MLLFKKNKIDAEASQAEPRPSNLLTNFLNLLSGRFVGDIATFVLFIVLTRSFGEEGIGQYSFATMIGGICFTAADFGLYNYTLKEVGRHRHAAKDRYSEIFVTRLICTVVTLVCFVPIVLVAPVSTEVKWIWILIGSSQLFMGLMSGFAAIFVAHERMDIGALIASSASWLVAVSGIAAAFLGGDLVTVCGAILLAYFVSFLCAGVFTVRQYQFIWGPFSSRKILRLLRDALPFGLRQLLRQVGMRLDIIFIGLLLGASQVGAYAVAYRLVFMLFLTFSFIGHAILPSSSRLFKESHEEFVTLAQRSMGVVVLLSVPAMVGLMLLAPEVIALFFGQGFEISSGLLKALAVLIAIFPMVVVMQMLLDSSDRQISTMISEAVGVTIGLVAHGTLIPIFGLYGAVAAAIITESAILAVVTFRLREIISWSHLGTRLGIAVLGSAAFALVLLSLPKFSIFIFMPLAVVIYVVVIGCFSGVREQELKALIKLVRKPAP